MLEKVRAYATLTKPGIIAGNAITAAGGFALASAQGFDAVLFFYMLLGLSCVVASGCVVNNYFDKEADAKMARTQRRAFVRAAVSSQGAVLFAILLLATGTHFLFHHTNTLTLLLALFGFFMYIVVYTRLKYHTSYGTLIGSVAGSIPPVVGYCAVTGELDMAALLLFAMVTLWQMPHFYAIAIRRIDDYIAASIPVLPLVKGVQATKVHMLCYVVGFLAVTSLLTFLSYTGTAFLAVTLLFGVPWIYLSIRGFVCDDDQKWARQMFIFSLVIINALFLSIPFSTGQLGG